MENIQMKLDTENAGEHHQFNFERLVSKDLVFNDGLVLFYKL